MTDEQKFAGLRRALVSRLREAGIIRTPAVELALLRVPREDFVWSDTRAQAYVDTPLPLGRTGQTISAPHMVAIMLEELRLAPGQAVLEVGAGTGYSAALAADIVAKQTGQTGSVVALERMEELVVFARRNLARTTFAAAVEVVLGDGTLGYPPRSTKPLYDRIVVTAAAPRIPNALEQQLRSDGILLLPVGGWEGQMLVRVTKAASGRVEREEICGCIFVPLIGAEGYGTEAWSRGRAGL